MTTALLDTHALVWAITDPDRLGSSARSIITDPTIDLAVSAASAWELATRVRLGRFPSAEPIVAQYDVLIDRLGARRLDITTTHALRSGSLNWTHRDPFDRMLAAQAMLEHAVLVSVDRSFHELAGLSIVW